MSGTNDKITIAEDRADVALEIDRELQAALRTALPQAENSSFVLSARNSDGGLVGGLAASTSYGWLLIKMLWVAEAARQRGLGRSLMAWAEEKGRAVGCHAVWLETSNPQALRFYRGLGFEPFGQLANADGQKPESHCRWFLKKAL